MCRYNLSSDGFQRYFLFLLVCSFCFSIVSCAMKPVFHKKPGPYKGDSALSSLYIYSFVDTRERNLGTDFMLIKGVTHKSFSVNRAIKTEV